ncbi:MAG: 50S ribosomal protein L22 [Deltaproteobacteria bacterium]|nr:50S ribosomal protein L22 [Deltaproteobacteria bacterium]
MKKSVTATFRHVRITPNKLRAVVDLVRGKRVDQAIDLLRYCERRGAKSVLKIVKSALANADQQGGIDVDRLVVGIIRVDDGPRWRRFRPRSRGMAHPIIKRSSHLNIELIER